jgi:hypothetical protein
MPNATRTIVIDRPPAEVFAAVTIADIRAADDPVSHQDLVGRWAQDVWDAYVDLHLVARTWINATAP